MFRSFHGVPRRARSAIVSAALLISSITFVTSDAWGVILTAFGEGQISVPSNVPTGTIIARTYYTPQQFCGKDSCEITSVTLSEKGSIWSTAVGPDIETTVSGLSTRMLFDGVPITRNTRTRLRNTVEVQLFRDSRAPQNGSLKPGIFNSYYATQSGGIFGETTLIYLAAATRFINGTCSVPDQTVTLPTVGQNDFKGVGSTAGSIGFQLRLNNCPAGYNRIGYQFSPIDGAAASMPGTLNLRPDSTATGLGIRITDGGGQPLPFQQSQTVTGYDKNTGGSPTVSLNAAYIQTGATVGSGSVRAGAQILLDYQ
ncbi:fimbrial protein [Burkholderia ubonensis]|uniref:fimbrial protein n=1 Tax=Burkholderia ubonensis TaxID=101571 RepID=UPI0007C7710C|nr:fimbrial protein [Burkholderia ubonensis]